MKKLIIVGFILLLILCVGCGKKETIDLAPAPESTTDQGVKQEEKYEVTDESFKPFFIQYFSLEEEDILELNQNLPKVNEEYWKAHAVYKKKLQGLVEKYFAAEVIKKLGSEFLYDELHLPKKLIINEYATFGPATVQQAEIVSTRTLGDNKVYEVAVMTRNKVQNINKANKEYIWDKDKGYYVKGTGNQTFVQGDEKKTYLDLHEPDDHTQDEIQLIHKYWIEVKADKKLQILSVREASPLKINEETRNRADNASYVTRVPYHKEVSEKEQSTIKKVFGAIMSQQRPFYQYYEKAITSSFDVFALIWQKNMGLDKEVLLVADYYQDAFAPYMNPYKDNINQMTADMKKAVITTSAYGTQMQPRFIVTIPVKALLNNNEVAYYNYKYYAGMEKSKIEFIQFMNMEEITEDTYLGKEAVPEGEKVESDKESAEKETPQPVE